MIKLLRVDHRLLHGQVAMTWTQELDTNCILIACDAVVKDDVRKTTLKLARPAGVKLVIKSVDDSIEALRSGVTDKYRLFIVVESIEDAYRLAKGYSEIEHINIGGTKPREGADVRLSSTVFATDLMLTQAILIGLVAMCVTFEWALGTCLASRPIVTGVLIGLVMGDLQTGIIVGATLEMVFIGSVTIGAAVPPDVITGGILGTAFAISTGQGAEVALTLAFPIASLYLIIDNALTLIVMPFFVHKADDCVAKGDLKGMERMHLLGGFIVKSLPRFFVCSLAFYLGTPVMNAVLNAIPEFVSNGLVIAGGFIPALGIALLASMIVNKQTAIFFVLGFALCAYMSIPILGIAIIGLCLAVILVVVQPNFIAQTPQLSSEGSFDDDDF